MAETSYVSFTQKMFFNYRRSSSGAAEHTTRSLS
jgi:hypothetical protein